MEKYLTPSCLEFIKERLTAMRDIGIRKFRGAGNENWELFKYFVPFQAPSDWLGLVGFFSHTLHNKLG
jgi:hypothetical protein